MDSSNTAFKNSTHTLSTKQVLNRQLPTQDQSQNLFGKFGNIPYNFVEILILFVGTRSSMYSIRLVFAITLDYFTYEN